METESYLLGLFRSCCLLSFIGIVIFCLLLLVVRRSAVVGERFETERDTNPVGLLQADDLFHRHDGSKDLSEGKEA